MLLPVRQENQLEREQQDPRVNYDSPQKLSAKEKEQMEEKGNGHKRERLVISCQTTQRSKRAQEGRNCAFLEVCNLTGCVESALMHWGP